jgi:L-ascorbate metabolism protein UlaG (beta-lactamase superfamily)
MASRVRNQPSARAQSQLGIRLVGGPTAILEYGGLRWLTDPALSPPGEYGGLTKLTGPAVEITQNGPIDVVLLSHHHHSDNLDPAGRAFLPSAKRVLSTTNAAEELGGNIVGMEPWSEIELASPQGGTVKVTAVHAQHGPDGSDDIQGPVLGFVLSAPGAGEIYVSGDNASRDVVRSIVGKIGQLPVAILNAGAVQLSKFDGAYLTLAADHAADVAQILGARVVIPLHFEGWAHFTRAVPMSSRQHSRATGSATDCSCSSAVNAPTCETGPPDKGTIPRSGRGFSSYRGGGHGLTGVCGLARRQMFGEARHRALVCGSQDRADKRSS